MRGRRILTHGSAEPGARSLPEQKLNLDKRGKQPGAVLRKIRCQIKNRETKLQKTRAAKTRAKIAEELSKQVGSMKVAMSKAGDESERETDESINENPLADAMEELKLENEIREVQNDEAAFAHKMDKLEIKETQGNTNER